MTAMDEARFALIEGERLAEMGVPVTWDEVRALHSIIRGLLSEIHMRELHHFEAEKMLVESGIDPDHMSDEGVTLYPLPREWRREIPGFPVNRIERAHIPAPIGAYYQLTGEVFASILADAGWTPVSEPSEPESP